MASSAPDPLQDEDAALVARCRAGDGSAWGVLVRRYQRLVYGVVARTGLDADTGADVFQTVFSRLLNHLPRLDDPSRLRAWIVTTAKREAQLQSTRARRFVALGDLAPAQEGDAGDAPDPEVADEAAGPDALLIELQQLDALRDGLERLDDRCRRLIAELFQDEDRPDYAGIASRLGMPIGSIGPTRARCLEKLRRLVGPV